MLLPFLQQLILHFYTFPFWWEKRMMIRRCSFFVFVFVFVQINAQHTNLPLSHDANLIFEKEFQTFFKIIRSEQVGDSNRTLYLMKKGKPYLTKKLWYSTPSSLLFIQSCFITTWTSMRYGFLKLLPQCLSHYLAHYYYFFYLN